MTGPQKTQPSQRENFGGIGLRPPSDQGQLLERKVSSLFKLNESFRFIDRIKFFSDEIFNKAYLERVTISDQCRDFLVTKLPDKAQISLRAVPRVTLEPAEARNL